MRVPIRFVLAGFALLLAGRGYAQGPNPMAAIKANNWSEAQAIASGFADPVAQKLVHYLRLRAPGAATSSEIADFMQRNPDWPAQAMLERRRQESVASDPDDASVLAQCDPAISLASAVLRCAEATANAGRTAEANALARKAWVEAVDTANGEAAFLHRWGGIATAEDQWARFERLAWLSDSSAATRQIVRLTGVHHAAAEARLAAKRDDPQAEALARILPPAMQNDPGLVLDRERSLRRTGRTADAAALLTRTTDAQNLPAFWAERNLLARKLLRDGDAKTAYAVVTTHGQTADEQRADAEFLAGFIALRMLHDPTRAAAHFQSLTSSHSVITQSRAHYWLGRTAAAAGKNARPEYEKSAAWPTTFYGQLAILALGESPATRIGKQHDPAWTQDTALGFAGHEVLRAAAWLIAWGDPQRARVFLMRMDELAPIAAERALTAAFAIHAGMPDGAVFIARRMGRDGIALPHLGWPAPYSPATPPDPAFSLGIMRQESSFDVGAVSPSGARGLMQLMPPTATAVAKELGIPAAVPTLTVDANYNIRLGTTYLHDMLTRFDNCLPLAAAAYNAGPHRVAQWLDENGDPRTGPIDMVDWIELIPVAETRNYVQRVSENVLMYRAERNDPAPILPATPWTR
ncbi:MAG TPA: transglycosylase [Acetobacteraceae bacterium]|jgi:soluble lytic murein transglycosylase|nr:transglycosylase [Acetobacteraceae bacterium]